MKSTLLSRYIVYQSFIQNSIWAVLGAFISKGLNFGSVIFAARIVGPKVFGEYNVIQTTVGLFGTVSGLGLGLAATKLIAEWKVKDPVKVGDLLGSLYVLSLVISIFVALVFFFSSTFISGSLLNNVNLSSILKLSAVIVIFDAINGVQNGILSGFESFKKIALINFVVGILSTPLIIAGAYYFGLFGLTGMLLVSRFSSVLITRFFLNDVLRKFDISINYEFSLTKVTPIFKISIPSFLTNMAISPVGWVSTTIFINQPLGYSTLGTYNAANQLRQLVLFLPDSAGKVSIPQLSREYGEGRFKDFRKTVVLTFCFNLVLSLIPAIIIYACSFLFKNFIGSDFKIDDILVISVLATSILVAISNAIGYVFICSNLIWYDFVLRVFWGIAQILLVLFFGKNHGAIGYSVSILGAYLLYIFLQIVVLVTKFSLVTIPRLQFSDI